MHKRPVEPSMQPGRYKTITRPFSWPCRGKYEALGAVQNSGEEGSRPTRHLRARKIPILNESIQAGDFDEGPEGGYFSSFRIEPPRFMKNHSMTGAPGGPGESLR